MSKCFGLSAECRELRQKVLIPSCVHKGSKWLPDEGDREDRGDAGDVGDAGEITCLPSPSSSPSLCTRFDRNLVSAHLGLRLTPLGGNRV